MSDKKWDEVMPPFTPAELREKARMLKERESEMHKILYAPFFLEQDRKAREFMKRSPIPEEFRKKK
jgi:hypothetical protein